MPYPNYVLEFVRQRQGLEPDDTSQDAKFNSKPGKWVLRQMVGWSLGDSDWADVFLGWIEDCGGEIVWKDKS